MSNIDEFLDSAAEHHGDLDDLVDIKREAYRDRLEELLYDVGKRDKEVFQVLKCPIKTPIILFLSVPIYHRNMQWVAMFAQTLAACRIQAWVEVFGGSAIQRFEIDGVEMQKLADNLDVAEKLEASNKRDLKSRIKKIRDLKNAKR